MWFANFLWFLYEILMQLAVELKEEKKRHGPLGGAKMLDLIFIALVVVFFAVSFWYVRFCERV
jgi:hypothetical protein